jgi:hypothetical protein
MTPNSAAESDAYESALRALFGARLAANVS